MRMKKILSLLMLALVSIGTAWADTESSGNIGESNVSWIGKSMTLSGDFIAGKGGVKQGNMPDKGVKLRSNKGPLTFKVNAGYKVTGFKFYGCGNTTTAVTITGATVDGGSNQLSQDVELPAKDETKSGDIILTGLEAKDNITLTFAEGSSAQVVGTWEIEYIQEEVIVQEISGVTMNGVAISADDLATLKSTKALTIDGSDLNGLGLVDVTLSSGATTVTKAVADGVATYSFTINSTESYTITVNKVSKTYTEQGVVVYYSKDGTDVEGKDTKEVTANGITFTMADASKTFQYGTGSVTLGEAKYVPLKLSTGSAVNVTFPEGKVATKAIVYGWSANGNGKLSVFKESAEAEDKSVDVTGDVFYATNTAADVYPSVYEYTLDNWESLYFSAGGSASQPFVVIDFVLADKPAEATEATITVPKTITDGEYYYTTFSSDKALDFSGVEGIEAFSVKKNVGGDFMTGYTAKATLTKVEQVPANTGVLIRATAATSYSVPFADGEVAVLEDNDLVANSAKTDMVDLITKDGYNIATIPAVLKLNSIEDSEDTEVGFNLDEPEVVDGAYVTNQKFVEAGTAYILLSGEEAQVLQYSSLYNVNSMSLVVAGEEPEAVTINDIAALKAYGSSGEVSLKLTNAQVTYAISGQDPYYGEDYDYVVIEDATGGLLLTNTTLASYLTQGMILNGTLPLKVGNFYGQQTISASSNTISSLFTLEATEGTAEPKTIEDYDDYLDNYDWRFVKFSNASLTVKDGTYGPEPVLTISEIGDLEIPISDSFGILNEEPEDGSIVNVTGYIYNAYGNIAFQPVSIQVVPQTLTVTVGADGYATFCSDKALDFTEATSIKAYTATLSGTDITFTRIYNVLPANTGVLLWAEGGASEEEIPIVDGGGVTVNQNVLKGTTVDMAAGSLTGKYILAKNGENIGFYKAGATATLAAGKAYIEAPAGARIILPGGETTGINGVEAAEADAAVYNLQGQRIQKAQKGLNIKNGRKYIVR